MSVPTTKGGWLGSCNLDCVVKMPSLLSLVNPLLNLGFEADSWIHYCHKKILGMKLHYQVPAHTARLSRY